MNVLSAGGIANSKNFITLPVDTAGIHRRADSMAEREVRECTLRFCPEWVLDNDKIYKYIYINDSLIVKRGEN